MKCELIENGLYLNNTSIGFVCDFSAIFGEQDWRCRCGEFHVTNNTNMAFMFFRNLFCASLTKVEFVALASNHPTQ